MTAPTQSCVKRKDQTTRPRAAVPDRSPGTPSALKLTSKVFDYRPVAKKKKEKKEKETTDTNLYHRTQAFIAKGKVKYLVPRKNQTRRIKKMPQIKSPTYLKEGIWKVARRERVKGKSESWVICPVCEKTFTRQAKGSHMKVKVISTIYSSSSNG